MSTTSDGASVQRREHDRQSDSGVEPVVTQTAGEPPEQLKLLDDEYAQEILTVLSSGPKQGRALAERCEFSRSTVYRRLNSLEAAGLVTTDLRLDPNGNHCKEFALVRDRLRLSIDDGKITVTATSSSD